MYVKSLELKNFRNIESMSLQPDPGINLFYGSNAQGKTNILEAVCLACTTRSHRGSRDRDIIRIGQKESHIRMVLDRHGNEYRIDVHLRRNKSKGVAINGVPVKRASELYGICGIVFFSPEDLNMIKNGPAGRRKFMDALLCSVDRLYMADLARYNKCLSQRNALLHEIAVTGRGMGQLDVWDMQLAECGRRIIGKRRSFLEEFSERAALAHDTLTGGGERLEILYEPNVAENMFEEKLAGSRENDLRMKMTTAGPHRDDLCIRANGMDLRTFGSQGQQRTAALSMKMAEIRTISDNRHDMPILLLDDVLSELDRDRQTALLSCIEHTQTWITCTGLDEFVKYGFQADRMFHVVQGGIE